MKLLTEALKLRFQKLWKQDVDDPVIVTKFFTPRSSWTWLVVSYEPKEKRFFVYAHDWHWGEFWYLSLSEIESYGSDIERDKLWKECNFSKAQTKL